MLHWIGSALDKLKREQREKNLDFITFTLYSRILIVVLFQPGDAPSEQPIVGEGLAVVCNGEIYNHKEIKANSNAQLMNDGSDCAAIIHAFINSGYNLREACASIDGVFAFVMVDKDNIYIGRDPLGVRPLFYGFSGSGKSFSLAFHTLIRDVLVKSVEKRLMGNRQFGFMLSGGLDSSLIASIAKAQRKSFLLSVTAFSWDMLALVYSLLTEAKITVVSQRAIRNEEGRETNMTFSVVCRTAPDLEKWHRTSGEYLRSHEVLVITTGMKCLMSVPEVIYALETFDPLIVRCGIAHYLLCKHIAKTSDVKVLLSGAFFLLT
ncbi:class II glutamine amidotransferase [Cooperia oncophora]